MRQLATEADLDFDEAIVTLWDAGLTEVQAPGDRLHQRDVAAARRALGLPARRDYNSPAYWQGVAGLSDDAWAMALVELGIDMSPAAKTLPKGAVRRLQRTYGEATPPTDEPKLAQPSTAWSAPTPPAFAWHIVGDVKPTAIRHLSEEQVERIHFALAEDFARQADPISPAGVRDHNLLSSAISRPHTSNGDEFKYPSVEMAGAALWHSLALNHAFHNGNKRTALVTMLVFLDENGRLLQTNEDDLFRISLLLAQHKVVSKGVDRDDREVLFLAEWLCERVRTAGHGDRPMKWVRVKRILTAHGCFLDNATVGNRLNITRTVPTRTKMLSRPTNRVLRTQVYCAGDGTEAVRNTMAKIRADLWLDEDHGYDSIAFYDNKDAALDEFIATYQRTLKRLARL